MEKIIRFKSNHEETLMLFSPITMLDWQTFTFFIYFDSLFQQQQYSCITCKQVERTTTAKKFKSKWNHKSVE